MKHYRLYLCSPNTLCFDWVNQSEALLISEQLATTAARESINWVSRICNDSVMNTLSYSLLFSLFHFSLDHLFYCPVLCRFYRTTLIRFTFAVLNVLNVAGAIMESTVAHSAVWQCLHCSWWQLYFLMDQSPLILQKPNFNYTTIQLRRLLLLYLLFFCHWAANSRARTALLIRRLYFIRLATMTLS